MKYYILYNPYANNGEAKIFAEIYYVTIQTNNSLLLDITKISDYQLFFENLDTDDIIILFGGDGTLNRLINNIESVEIKNSIYYYPAGTGNDFIKDVNKDNRDNCIEINKYIKNLPKVKVKGKEYKFINGVGYGIDGYCTFIGDQKRVNNEKNIDYTNIAIKGLLFHYKPTNAKVVVDGKEYEFKKVWIAPTMYGRYYGGGMIPTPNQRRGEGYVSLMLFHGCGKIKTLSIFPSIFKGTHIKRKKHVSIFTGKNIKVSFDEPRPLQIDGETVADVLEYEVNF